MPTSPRPTAAPALRHAIEESIELLDSGQARVAEKKDGEWVVNQWLKKAVLLYFRTHDNAVMDAGYTRFFDKVPLKYAARSQAAGCARRRARRAARRRAPRLVRRAERRADAQLREHRRLCRQRHHGGHLGHGRLCAQIGKNVHLSGGVGIGGVLEPLQAAPTIIEDNCFIGARSEVVEGVIVEEGSVISMGVFIGQSTKIYDRSTGKILQGRVPPGSVVVSGNLPSSDGKYSLYCAVIVKRVDAKTRAKTSINELRDLAENEELLQVIAAEDQQQDRGDLRGHLALAELEAGIATPRPSPRCAAPSPPARDRR